MRNRVRERRGEKGRKYMREKEPKLPRFGETKAQRDKE